MSLIKIKYLLKCTLKSSEKTNVLSALPLLFSKQLRDRTPSKRWFLPNCFSAYFNKTCTNTQFLVNFVTLNILDKQMLVCLC